MQSNKGNAGIFEEAIRGKCQVARPRGGVLFVPLDGVLLASNNLHLEFLFLPLVLRLAATAAAKTKWLMQIENVFEMIA